MTLPIYAYGHPILRQKTEEIDTNYSDLKSLVNNMWETMYNANGVGLAAPQIGLALRLFVVDASPFSADPELSEAEQQQIKRFKHVFINPSIKAFRGDMVDFNEGCLSIPDIRAEIKRPNMIKVEFLDENFNHNSKIFKGLLARVILHENDHINGVLFTDKITNFKRKIIQNKLDRIKKGKIETEYKMSFL